MRILISTIVVCLFSVILNSQNKGSLDNFATSKKTLSIEIGYQYFTFHTANASFGLSNYVKQSGIMYSKTLNAGMECIYTENKKMAFGPKIGYWISGGSYLLSVGSSVIAPIYNSELTVQLRPELGIAYKKTRFYYGYNFGIINPGIIPLNKHLFGLSLLFDAKTIEKNALGVDPHFRRKKNKAYHPTPRKRKKVKLPKKKSDEDDE